MQSGAYLAIHSVTAFDDLGVDAYQVVAAHARLARDARGDDDDVRASGLVVAIRADGVGLIADDRASLVEVERLALRQAFDDVDEHDVGVISFGQSLCSGSANMAGANDRNFLA